MAHLYGPTPGEPPALIATADLAGLSANDVDDRPVGELFGALSEKRSGLIRYLDISIRTAGKHVLVPIGHARIDRESVPPRVRLRAATQEDLVSVPAFLEHETRLDAGYHERVMAAHGRLFYGSRYYAHPAYDHALVHVGERAAEAEEAPGAERPVLEPLSEATDLRIGRGGPQLIGWRVCDADAENVGTVRDLLVDPRARRARYAIIDLDGLDRAAALPVGYLEAQRDDDEARLPALTREDVRLLPPYEPPLTREEENRIHATIEGRLSGDRYFERPDFRPIPGGGPAD